MMNYEKLPSYIWVNMYFKYSKTKFLSLGHPILNQNLLVERVLTDSFLSLQAVAFMLADMAINIETARLAWKMAAWQTDNGIRNSYFSSIAKAHASDIANKCVSDAVQVRKFISA
jgi:hypothetical protein